jgi:hypothetical protein
MAKRPRLIVAILVLLGCALCHAAEPEAPDTILSRISSLCHNAAKPVGIEFFIDYYGVLQGNPVGGESQSFAYSQYLPFGFEWKEPLGWRGGGVRVSAVSGAGRDLSATIGNAFEVSQAWTDNTLFLYEAYVVQKAFDDRLEMLVGRISSAEFFAGLPALNLLVTGGLNSVPIALKLNSPFTGSTEASWAAGARWLPAEETYIMAGLFQARADMGESGPYHGLDLAFGQDDGGFMVAEIGWTPNSARFTAVQEDRRFTRNSTELPGDGGGLPGIYKLGAYFANQARNSYPGGWGSDPFGFYLLGQQALWEKTRGKPTGPHLSVFGGATWSPPTGVTEVPWSGFLGTAWQGPLPGLPTIFTCWARSATSADRMRAAWVNRQRARSSPCSTRATSSKSPRNYPCNRTFNTSSARAASASPAMRSCSDCKSRSSCERW